MENNTDNWKKSIKSLLILLKKAQAVLQKIIMKECNVSCFELLFFTVFLMDVIGAKIKWT